MQVTTLYFDNKNQNKGGIKIKRPKRRKHKDNPYILEYIEVTHNYYVYFKDGSNTLQRIKVSKDIFDVLDRFELDDLKELNEYSRHIEHSEIYDNNLTIRAIEKAPSVEEIVEKKTDSDKLHEAINSLSEIQKTRVRKFYFENKTQQEIADEEGVDIRSVQYTLNIALNNLKKIFKK